MRRRSRTLAALLLGPMLAAAPAAAQDPPAAPADTVAPSLSGVQVSPKVARRTTPVTLTFALSEPAAVAGVVRRHSRGVRTAGGRCLQRTPKRRGPRCTRRTKAGGFSAPSAAQGINTARLSMRRLAVGSYTLTLTPTDAAGNRGADRSVTFRVDL